MYYDLCELYLQKLEGKNCQKMAKNRLFSFPEKSIC